MGKRYDVFISYSHASDTALAEDLERGLKNMNRRWNQRRALEVFRDESSLSASPHLWQSLAVQLDAAAYALVLLSTDAADSHWVGREIDHFLSSHGEDRLLLALTGGELVWDDATGDWSAASTAVPPVLRGRLTAEPCWVDLRWVRGRGDASLRGTRFRAAVATLAAPVHGMSRDELDGEDVRAHRRFVLIRRTAVAALLLLLSMALVASVLALFSRHQTNAERSLRRQVELAADELRRVNEDLDATNSQLDTTNGELEVANGQLASTNAVLDDRNRQLDAANATLDTRNQELDSANRELDETNRALAISNGSLNAANTRLAVVNGQLNAANIRLAELEAFASKSAGAAICSSASANYLTFASEYVSGQYFEQLSARDTAYASIVTAVNDPNAGIEGVRTLVSTYAGVFAVSALGDPPLPQNPLLGKGCSSTPGYPFRPYWGTLGDPPMNPYIASFMPNCADLQPYCR